jgi:hypothetical protein
LFFRRRILSKEGLGEVVGLSLHEVVGNISGLGELLDVVCEVVGDVREVSVVRDVEGQHVFVVPISNTTSHTTSRSSPRPEMLPTTS